MLVIPDIIFSGQLIMELGTNTKINETTTESTKNTILQIILLTLSMTIFVFFIFSINCSEDKPKISPNAVNANPAKTVLIVI